MAVDSATDEKMKMIILRSSDGEEFQVTKKVATMIRMIRHAIEDDDMSISIPIPKVNSKILSLMLEYCTKHAATTETKTVLAEEEELEAWDKNFVDVDGNMLYDIVTTAHFLGIDGLFDLACKKVAEIICTNPLDEVRRFLNLGSGGGFSPAEEEEMNHNNAWAFEY